MEKENYLCLACQFNLLEATECVVIYCLPDYVNIFELAKSGNKIHSILANLEDFWYMSSQTIDTIKYRQVNIFLFNLCWNIS